MGISASAEDTSSYIIINKVGTPGQEVRYQIGTQVDRIVLTDAKLLLQRGDRVVAQMAESEFASFSFAGVTDGVTTPTADGAEGQTEIYTIDGRRVAAGTAIDALPRGVYVVRQGHAVRKIVRP